MAIVIPLMVAAPLIVFIVDFARSIECLRVSSEGVRFVDQEMVEVKLVVNYCSSAPIKRLTLNFGGTNVTFDDVRKGAVERTLIIPLKDFQRGVKEITVDIAGIYKLLVSYGG